MNALEQVVLAFGFGNVAMLGWLAAAAAPLLIHLWSRHRFREAPWAAMQFLLAAMRKNARRMQLQQWLLLAVRTLIIVLVVLAVAEPYGERLIAGGSAAPTHKTIVVDGSFSMAYRGDDGTNFARAKQLAAELVRNSRSGDVFTVILMASPPKTILGPEVIDRADVATQIESLTFAHTGGDLASTLRFVEEALSAEKENHKLPERQEVYFFTDLQANTWGDRTNTRSETQRKEPAPDRSGSAENSAGQLSNLAQKAPVTIIDVGRPRATNLAVTQFKTSEPFVTPGRDVTFDVSLHQFGQEPFPNCNVEFLVDGAAVGEQTVDVPAGGDANIRFTHRFQSAGTHALSVRAAADRLEIDNSRWLVVPVLEEVRVLCVSGREDAAKFLADALQPDPNGDSAFQPVVVSEGDLAELKLDEFDCIFMCNVAQLTPSEAERIGRYAEAGRGVVFFLGDRVDPENYNALKSAVKGGSGGVSSDEPDPGTQLLLPAQIGELVANPQFGLDPLEYRHPIVSPFRGRERAGLLTTPVARYYRLSLPESRRGAETAVATRSGDPFIVTAPLGRGHVVLVATDASLASVDAATGEPWTTWPTWPSFLPMVREMLAYAASGRRDLQQYAVGATLSGTVADSSFDAPKNSDIRILRPDSRAAPVSIQSTPAGFEWSYANTDVSGTYNVQGLPQSQSLQFAVNVDTSESDLAKADTQDLPPQIAVRDTWKSSESANTNGVLGQSAWNQGALWAALGLLFAESFMAWRFGRGGL